MIHIRNLSRTWGNFRLAHVSFSASRGEYVVILGPTGCGKTLLLETVAGIHKGYSGNILIDGKDVSGIPPYRRSIGFVYQKSLLFPNLTVAENIAFGMRVRGVGRARRERMLYDLAALLKITYLLDRDVTSLSGGEMQKVALARALAIEPTLLLLDEPLSPLDQASKDRLIDELENLHVAMGTTTLHVTHDHNIARRLADRIVLLRNGSVVQVGEVADVFSKPATHFAAQFVRAPNIILGNVMRFDGQYAEIMCRGSVLLRARSNISGTVGITVPPEEIKISVAAPPPNCHNVLNGVIERVEREAGLLRVEVQTDIGPLQAVMPPDELAAVMVPGDNRIYAHFHPDTVHVFRDDADRQMSA